MSTTVAVAKIGTALMSNKNGRTLIATLIGAVIVLFLLPLIVYMGIMSNLDEVKIDTDSATQSIIANMSVEEQAKLQHIEDVMNGIDDELKSRKLDSSIKQAQAVYACALYDVEKNEADFIKKYADCWEKATDTNDLLNRINTTFGLSISLDDFNNLMSVIKNTVIDITFDTPSDKNNLDLVKWAETAYNNHWGYVWGSHGNVLTDAELRRLKKTFGSYVTDKEDYIRANWLGRRTADCVGLIKSYGWYNADSGKIVVGSNGMQDVTADGMYFSAKEKGPINTMPDVPGLAVWHEGHIGIYVGDGYVIHAANIYAGVIKTPITQSEWTAWLKIPYISYTKQATDSDGH